MKLKTKTAEDHHLKEVRSESEIEFTVTGGSWMAAGGKEGRGWLHKDSFWSDGNV